MMILDAFLVHRAVAHRRLRLRMARHDHGLLQRHPPVQGVGQGCPAEPVRVGLIDSRPLARSPDDVLDPRLRQTAMRPPSGYEQRRAPIRPAVQILLHVQVRPVVQVDPPFLASLPEYDQVLAGEADVVAVQGCQFRDPHRRAVEELHHRLIPERAAVP